MYAWLNGTPVCSRYRQYARITTISRASRSAASSRRLKPSFSMSPRHAAAKASLNDVFDARNVHAQSGRDAPARSPGSTRRRHPARPARTAAPRSRAGRSSRASAAGPRSAPARRASRSSGAARSGFCCARAMQIQPQRLRLGAQRFEVARGLRARRPDRRLPRTPAGRRADSGWRSASALASSCRPTSTARSRSVQVVAALGDALLRWRRDPRCADRSGPCARRRAAAHDSSPRSAPASRCCVPSKPSEHDLLDALGALRCCSDRAARR